MTRLGTFTSSVPDQEYVAYVLGDSPWPTYGLTIRTTPSSKVYYFGFMEGAQVALGQPSDPNTGAGWTNYSPNFPPQDTARFVNMLRAVGKGIGNTAAHEMGHHLEDYGAVHSIGVFPNMDCGASPDNKLTHVKPNAVWTGVLIETGIAFLLEWGYARRLSSSARNS